MLSNIPVMRWQDFYKMFSNEWQQGDHVVTIGPTGSGKTQLLRQLLPLRTYTTVFATKPYDDSMDELASGDGYRTLDDWPVALSPHSFPRRVLWPNAKTMDSVTRYQKPTFKLALNHIYTTGGWTVVVDELWFFTNVLKLGPAIKLYLTQARSCHITLVNAAQRTAWVPVEVFNQSRHHFYFQEGDERNLGVIGGIAWKNRELVRETVANLPLYHFLYINARTGKLCITMVT